MFKTGLFGSDAIPSEKLITSGPFNLHRNPFYASMGLGISLFLGLPLAANLFSGAPNYPASAALIAGVVTFLWTYHRNVKRDEKALEKAFGNEYRRYKAKTPRYFPAFWNLFRRNK